MNATQRIALALLVATGIEAQQPDTASITPARGRTIVGVVADSSERPIDSAEVFIPALKRKTTARADGRFRFDDVKPGTYQIAARRLGYYPQTRTVVVTKEQGGVASFALVPYVRGLAPVVTSSRRGGLSGVVGDTAWGAVKDAEITVVSTTRSAKTDSMGNFFIDLAPGKHIIRVTREGYASQIMTVSVPKDSGRRMMLFLKPSTLGEAPWEINAILDLEDRLARRNPVYSTLFTREDINKVGWKELTEIAQAGAGRYVDPGCLAIVDGGPKREFIWALRASEIEGVEVYRARTARGETRSIMVGGAGGGRMISGNLPITQIPQPMGGCQDSVFVWLRK